MPPKRAEFIICGNDVKTQEIMKFLENAGVILDIRDTQKKPLIYSEIARLIGHFPPEHYLNPNSKSFEKHQLDKETPIRSQLIQFIAEDPTLLRYPIIRTPRLFTIGYDKKKICEMLQINPNAKAPQQDEEKENGQPSPAPSPAK
jgi:arsenate reductase-like glutaredoxin family protein